MDEARPRVEQIVQLLESFRSRIEMYICPADVANARSFLAGVTCAAQAVGVRWDREVWWGVQRARGWQQRAVGPVPQMQERGLDTPQIINELIDIEVDTIRRANAAA